MKNNTIIKCLKNAQHYTEKNELAKAQKYLSLAAKYLAKAQAEGEADV